MSKKIGIDIGSRFIRAVSVDKTPVSVVEPSVFALSLSDEKILACGNEALLLSERVPGSVKLVYPLSGDAVSERKFIDAIMSYIMKKLKVKGQRPDAVISVSGTQDEETDRICVEFAQKYGAGDVFMTDSVYAAAKGCGANIRSDVAVVNIGATVTQMAVYSRSKAIGSATIKVAGNSFDRAVASYVYKKYHLSLSDAESESLKIKIGTMSPSENELSAEGVAMRRALGLPRAVTLTENEIAGAYEAVFDDLVDAVITMLNKLSFEVDKVILTGGGAELRCLAEAMSPLVGVSVEKAENPSMCVIGGLKRLIETGEI